MELPGYFSVKEISCNCGCSLCIVQPSFYFKINWLRSLLGVPVKVTSWNRCVKHNRKEGGSKTSSHLTGWACDLSVRTSYLRYKIVNLAGLIDFRGVGISDKFIHLDDDPCKPTNRIWTY